MKMLKRLALFIVALFVYLILREMLNFYVLAYTANPYLGYLVLVILLSVLFYFVIIPLYRISRVSGDPGPVRKKRKEAELMEMRLQRRLGNKHLKDMGYTHPVEGSLEERYELSTEELSQRCDEMRRRYVVSPFLQQCRFPVMGLSMLFSIFSANVNLVKEIFVLYTGRASGRDLFQILKQIYYSIAIGGSEGVEFAVEELISKMGSDTLKSIPFFDKVMASIAGGFTNAILLSRISLIAENYCRMTTIESTHDLSPDPVQILDSTKAIVAEPIRRIKQQLNDIAKQKAIDFSRYAINPSRTVIEKALDKFRSQSDEEETQSAKRSIAIGLNPLKYFSFRRLRKSRK